MALAIILTVAALAAWLLLASRHWLIPGLTLGAAAFPAGAAHAALVTHPRGWPFIVAVDAVATLALGVLAAVGFAAYVARTTRPLAH
ncbi:MAG: hypothetical protein K8W52_30400 [Deltaproteobacteria bacterium]|nr:hypothetical protein [Deltaproteobacteria bacterium]